MLGDLVTVARNRLDETRGPGESSYAERVVLPMGETRTRYHIAIDVDDRAGVLAEIATAFAEEDVSIQTMRQEGRGEDAQLVVVSHDATDAALSATVERLRGLSCVREVTSVMRVEGVGSTERWSGRQWRGVIEEYRDAARPDPRRPRPVTLREGGTPLVALRLADRRLRRARSGSRSRATTRPARSRTAA